eukprot:Gb_03095 [translate_table: standard]
MQALSLPCNPCLSRLLWVSNDHHDSQKQHTNCHHQRSIQSVCSLCNPASSANVSMSDSTNPKSPESADCRPFPVVGKQFCSPSLIVLTVRKKPLVFSGGGFTVTDSNGRVVFRVDGRGPSLRDKLLLMDGVGKPLLTLHRKVLTMYNRWDGFSGEKRVGQKPIFSVRRSIIFQTKGSTEVFMGSNKRKKHSDYKIEGCYLERSCTVYNGSDPRAIVAEVKRKCATSEVMLSKDVYIVVVRAGLDQAFIMGLVVILHQMSRENDSI